MILKKVFYRISVREEESLGNSTSYEDLSGVGVICLTTISSMYGITYLVNLNVNRIGLLSGIITIPM